VTGPGLDERGGGASVEAALLAIGIGLLIALAIAGGRLASAEAAADQAARSAARIASLQRDPDAAQVQATGAARQSLADQGLACDGLTVVVDASQLTRALGAPAAVRATVSCSVRWSDLGLPLVTGPHEIEADAVSPIDRLRERP
jgi:Flp pilus assembly protein TadG